MTSMEAIITLAVLQLYYWNPSHMEDLNDRERECLMEFCAGIRHLASNALASGLC